MSEEQASYEVSDEFMPLWYDLNDLCNPPHHLVVYQVARLAGHGEATSHKLSGLILDGDLAYQAHLLHARLVEAGYFTGGVMAWQVVLLFRDTPAPIVLAWMRIFCRAAGWVLRLAMDVAGDSVGDFDCMACIKSEIEGGGKK